MLDTIVLTINYGSYQVVDHDKFIPSTKSLFEGLKTQFGARLYERYIQNPPKKGPYGPRLTITARKTGNRLLIPLRIEFSIPKLIYGNNVSEVGESDFAAVVKTLRKRLKEMGVIVWTKNLENAAVSVAHFSKNIPLSNGYTASFAVRELSKLDLTGKLDINRTHYRNGKVLYAYCGSYEVVLYDKMYDVERPEGRAIDKGRTLGQLTLLESYRSGEIPEILRLEVRFVKKQKLNSVLKELGFKENPTFKEIFNKELSKAVLKRYWDFIGTERYAFLLKSEFEPEDLLEAIFRKSKAEGRRIGAKNALILLGIEQFVRKHGVRPLKSQICAYCSKRTWDRLKPFLKILAKIFKDSKPFGFVKDVESALEAFKPFRVDNVNQSKLK